MGTAIVVEHDGAVSSQARRFRRLTRFAVPFALLAALAVWWFGGGAFIGAPQGNRVGLPVEAGEEASFGIPLSADGSDAELRGVRARITPTAMLEWSVLQAGRGSGIGAVAGPLAPNWPIVPVDGARVSGDERLPTSVVATVRSSTPGVYRVSDITIDYVSGWRTRHEDSGFVGCVLVLPAGESYAALEARSDPLWQEYQDCSGAS